MVQGSVARPAVSRVLRWYVACVWVLALGALAAALLTGHSSQPFAARPWTPLTLALLTVIAGATPFALTSKVRVHVATVPQFATILLFPAPIAAAINAGAVLAYQVFLWRRGQRTAFDTALNTGQAALQAAGAGALFGLLAAGSGPADLLAAALAAALCSYVINVSVVLGATGLHLHRSPFDLWRRLVAVDGPQQVIQYTFGFGLAAVAGEAAFGAAVAVTVLAAYYALHLQLRVRQETCNSVEAMADALDQRVYGAPGRSRRLAQTAEQLGRALRLPAAEVALLRQAAYVCDLGLLGVPDALLQQPEPLTPSEQELVRRHVQIGDTLLARFPEYECVRPLLRAHHERPDGQGYPEGLTGGAIPTLAAILAVAGAYVALTSPRPDRPAPAAQAALAVLRAGRGSQWDAASVDAALVAFGDRETARQELRLLAGLGFTW